MAAYEHLPVTAHNVFTGAALNPSRYYTTNPSGGSSVVIRKNDLPRLRANLRTALETTITNAAERIADRARELVPVDTGFLQSSIVPVVVTSGFARGSSARFIAGVSARAHYWAHVEYGTIHMAARPYLTPARNEVARWLPGVVAAQVKRY